MGGIGSFIFLVPPSVYNDDAGDRQDAYPLPLRRHPAARDQQQGSEPASQGQTSIIHAVRYPSIRRGTFQLASATLRTLLAGSADLSAYALFPDRSDLAALHQLFGSHAILPLWGPVFQLLLYPEYLSLT